MQKIFFYTTFGCHLCEQVSSMILYFLEQNKEQSIYQFEAFDIIDDEQILKEYRTTIPVLKNSQTGQELFWPFDYEELCNFLPY